MSIENKEEWGFKTIAWVLIGLSSGVLLTIAVQHFTAKIQQNAPTVAAQPAASSEGAAPSLPAASAGACAASGSGAAIINTAAAAPPQTMIPSGVYYADSSSGYPIAYGGRAVGNNLVQPQAATPVYLDPGGNIVQPAADQSAYVPQIGRNGLVSNGPVDPPSTHGRAYSR